MLKEQQEEKSHAFKKKNKYPILKLNHQTHSDEGR